MEVSMEVLRDLARNEAALPSSRRDACMQWVFRLVKPTVGADSVSDGTLTSLFAELDAFPKLKTDHQALTARHQALTDEHEALKASHGQLLATHDALQSQIALESQSAIESSRNALLAAIENLKAEATARHENVWFRRLWRWIARSNETS
jgi:hypothetical protein